MAQKEDVIFLLFNAQPQEVEYILGSLDTDIAYSTRELRKRLLSDWGYSAQKDMNYSTRRLFDLGLINKEKTFSGKPGYVLTELGDKIRAISYNDRELYTEIMHFLHYIGYDENEPSSRKLFWSYRICCELVWTRKEVPSNRQLAALVQEKIAEEFPSLYASHDKGGRFNEGGVSNWKAWIKQLQPSPIASDGAKLQPRTSKRFELVLLALDQVYRLRNYRYGDPVILDEILLDAIARIFFLDSTNCRELIDLAAHLTTAIKLSDTFAGTSVTLLDSYNIDRM